MGFLGGVFYARANKVKALSVNLNVSLFRITVVYD